MSAERGAARGVAGRIPVAVTERHVHLTRDFLERLFATDVPKAVTLVGPRGRIGRVRVVGASRPENQVEISHSDAQLLGVQAPLRMSGDLKDTPGLLIEGPHATIRLDHGVIRALRHIHLHSDDAQRHGLRDGDRIDVLKDEPAAHTLFCDVLVRVSPQFRSELHVDAEEAGSAGLRSDSHVTLPGRPDG